MNYPLAWHYSPFHSWLKFFRDKNGVPDTYLDGVLDPSAQDGGFMYSGSGNSVDDFLIQRDTKVDVEGAAKVKYRQGDDFDPYAMGPNGTIHYKVGAGAQVVDPAHGVPAAHAGRALWSYDFSISAGIDGSSKTLAQLLQKYDVTLKFDVDPGEGVKYLELALKKAPVGYTASESGYIWVAADGKVVPKGTIVIGDDGGDAQVTQNSFNYAFISQYIDTSNAYGIQPYTFGAAQFDIQLEVESKWGNDEIIDLHTIVNVGQEPSSKDGPIVLLNHELDPTASIGGEIYQGSGNNDDDFQVSRNSKSDLEAGLRGHYRQGDNIEAAFVDEDGTIHFIVPDGPQVVDPAHGVPVAHSGRAAWSFTTSLDSAIEGSSKTLAQHLNEGSNFYLKIDMDPTDDVNFLVMKLAQGGTSQSGYQWVAADNKFVAKGTVLIPDDEGNAQVTQNDRNISFYTAFIDADPDAPGQQAYTFGPGEFDVQLVGVSKWGQELVNVDTVFHVV